jgi:putative transposase
VLHQEFECQRSRLPTLWTNSYVVAIVGGAPRSVIKRDVDDQKGR